MQGNNHIKKYQIKIHVNVTQMKERMCAFYGEGSVSNQIYQKSFTEF